VINAADARRLFRAVFAPTSTIVGRGGEQFPWCGPLTTPFSDYSLRMNGCRVSCDLEESYYPDIRLEGLRKTTKTISKNGLFQGRDLNPGLPEDDAGLLTTRHYDV
jgi:hypothetical protein